MEPPQPPIRPTEQRQHRRRIRVTRVPSCRAPALSERERIFLKLLLKEGTLRNKDFSDLTETPASTTNTTLNRLREAGLVEMVGKQRALTPYGRQIAQGL